MSVANTVMLPALLNILGTLREQGLPMGELLNAAGLRPSVFDPIDFDARIPTSAVLAVYDYAARALDDPAVSIRIAEGQKPEHLSVVGFVIATAATGVEAITRAARYARVAFDYGVDWQVFEEDDVIRISFPTSPTTLAERIATEVGVAAFLHYFRTMGRQDVVPSDVVFSHAAPADTRAHKAFFRGPIRWGAGVPGFAFDAAYAERSVLPKADRSMNQFFERYADDLLEQMQRGTTARARVRAIVEVELANGDPSSGQVAKRLAMSERSLRRTLREEGTTFREVVDEVRHGRALSLLRAPQMSVAQVAYLLGFSDVSTFSRAFKRWTGTSPRAFRRSEVQ